MYVLYMVRMFGSFTSEISLTYNSPDIYVVLIDELEEAAKIKAQLEMEVSTLKEELDSVESCRQKQKEEYSTNLEDLKKRVHDLQLGRTKDVEAARKKIDMMEQRLSTLIYVCI